MTWGYLGPHRRPPKPLINVISGDADGWRQFGCDVRIFGSRSSPLDRSGVFHRDVGFHQRGPASRTALSTRIIGFDVF